MRGLPAANFGSIALATLAFFGLYGLVAFLRRSKNEDEEGAGKARAHWRPLESVGIVVFIYFAAYIASQLLLGFILSVYAGLRGQTSAEVTNVASGSVIVQFITTALFYGIIALLVYLFMRLRQTAWSAIGWVKPRWRDIGYGLSGFAAYYAIYFVSLQIITNLVPGLNINQKQEIGFSTSSAGDSLALVFVSLVVLPPLVEEILARGVLYTGLRTKLPMAAAAVITSVCFAAAHLQAGSGNSLLWIAAIDTFTLSLVLVYLRERTGSLWPAIMLHALKNGLAFLVLFIFHFS